jgi:SAM-dependent methyltransferase
MPESMGGVWGTDIDGEAVRWCQKKLGRVGRFIQNGPLPPLPLNDDQFELVYAISVFTHLPEEAEQAWLRELARVLQGGGLFIGSVLGDEALAEIGDESEFLYADQVSYHRRRYIEREWGKVFEILEYIPRGINHHQDAVICTR